MKNLQQKGDTIVEVIIAMAVLSLVLGGAYASARHSLNATIQAHEHSTALKLAEGQLENLKYLSENNNIYIYDTGAIAIANKAFCVSSGLNIISATTTGKLAKDAIDFSDYPNPSDCININGINYYIAVGRVEEAPAGSKNYIFTVYVRWNSIHGTGQDTVTLAYKLDNK